jgi:hypothetical protein
MANNMNHDAFNSSMIDLSPPLTPEEQSLVKELVEDGLAIQEKFRPEPSYKQTGRGHYESQTVDEIRRARSDRKPKAEQ